MNSFGEAMTTLAQDDLPADLGILRATVQVNRVPVRDRGLDPAAWPYPRSSSRCGLATIISARWSSGMPQALSRS